MGHQAGCRAQLQEYKNQLQGFCRELEASRSRIEQAVELYRFLEEVGFSEETQPVLFSACSFLPSPGGWQLAAPLGW